MPDSAEAAGGFSWGLLGVSFLCVLVWLFAENRARRAALSAHLATAPLLRELWRTMPFPGKLFFSVLALTLHRAVLGGVLLAAVTCVAAGGLLLVVEAVSRVSPVLARAIAYPLAGAAWLALLAGGTIAVAVFFTLSLQGLADTLVLFGY